MLRNMQRYFIFTTIMFSVYFSMPCSVFLISLTMSNDAAGNTGGHEEFYWPLAKKAHSKTVGEKGERTCRTRERNGNIFKSCFI